MTTCVIEHVVFRDGPTVKSERSFPAGLREVVGREGLQGSTFRNDCVPFETLTGGSCEV